MRTGAQPRSSFYARPRMRRCATSCARGCWPRISSPLRAAACAAPERWSCATSEPNALAFLDLECDAELAGELLQAVPHFHVHRNAVLARFERLFVLDLTGDVDAVVARRLRRILERAQFGVHVGFELLGIAEPVDLERGEEVRE